MTTRAALSVKEEWVEDLPCPTVGEATAEMADVFFITVVAVGTKVG